MSLDPYHPWTSRGKGDSEDMAARVPAAVVGVLLLLVVALAVVFVIAAQTVQTP